MESIVDCHSWGVMLIHSCVETCQKILVQINRKGKRQNHSIPNTNYSNHMFYCVSLPNANWLSLKGQLIVEESKRAYKVSTLTFMSMQHGEACSYWFWLHFGNITWWKYALRECTLQAEPWDDSITRSLWCHEERDLVPICTVSLVLFLGYFLLHLC